MLKRLIKRPGVQALLAALLVRYLRFCFRTTRFAHFGLEHFRLLRRDGAPMIVVLWHEHLPLLPLFWREKLPGVAPAATPLCVLVSRHQDGVLIGRVLGHLGMEAVHGSSTHGGAAALRQLVAVIRRGQSVGLTPDGPRGPRRRAQPGVAALSALTGAPVLPAAVITRRHRRAGSWDRMAVPLPFTRGALVFAPPVMVPKDAGSEAFASALAAIEAGLVHAAGVAESAVGLEPVGAPAPPPSGSAAAEAEAGAGR